MNIANKGRKKGIQKKRGENVEEEYIQIEADDGVKQREVNKRKKEISE